MNLGLMNERMMNFGLLKMNILIILPSFLIFVVTGRK